MELLDSMTLSVTEVLLNFRARDAAVNQAAQELLAIGDELVAGMELERKFYSANDLHGWKAQMAEVDRLVSKYLDALTTCRFATGWRNR